MPWHTKSATPFDSITYEAPLKSTTFQHTSEGVTFTPFGKAFPKIFREAGLDTLNYSAIAEMVLPEAVGEANVIDGNILCKAVLDIQDDGHARAFHLAIQGAVGELRTREGVMLNAIKHPATPAPKAGIFWGQYFVPVSGDENEEALVELAAAQSKDRVDAYHLSASKMVENNVTHGVLPARLNTLETAALAGRERREALALEAHDEPLTDEDEAAA